MKALRLSLAVIILMGVTFILFVSCGDDLKEVLPDNETPGKVFDVDKNEYKTVLIGDQVWMAENLRTSRYRDGREIQTNLSDDDWWKTTLGAYAVYDHTLQEAEGIQSREEMVAAYGKLYNWYAVNNTGGLCPEGWRVPNPADWNKLFNYLISEYGLHNNWLADDIDGVANALKSCRQVDSPLGGACDTGQHPRWNSSNIHHGFDMVGFALFPSGDRKSSGGFTFLGTNASFWTALGTSPMNAMQLVMFSGGGGVLTLVNPKGWGSAVRCIRERE